MHAHPKIAHIIKEDDSRGASGLDRPAKQRPDNNFRTARLVHQSSPQEIVVSAKLIQAQRHTVARKRRPARDDNPRRFAPGVRVNYVNALKSVKHGDSESPSFQGLQLPSASPSNE
jgi:hypothetical protein